MLLFEVELRAIIDSFLNRLSGAQYVTHCIYREQDVDVFEFTYVPPEPHRIGVFSCTVGTHFHPDQNNQQRLERVTHLLNEIAEEMENMPTHWYYETYNKACRPNL